jgi:hypothetical protein
VPDFVMYWWNTPLPFLVRKCAAGGSVRTWPGTTASNCTRQLDLVMAGAGLPSPATHAFV